MQGNARFGADYMGRNAQGRAGGTKRRFEQAGCGARPIAPCSCAHKCATKHTALRALHDKRCRCCFFYAVGDADIGGGSADAPGPGAGGAHMHPARRPFPHSAGTGKMLNGAQILGGPVDGVVQVIGRPRKYF